MATSRYNEEEADFRFRGDYVDIDGTLNVDGTTTVGGGIVTLKLVSGPSGTVGPVWTSAPPAFSTYQTYVTFTAGSTTYRLPVFANE